MELTNNESETKYMVMTMHPMNKQNLRVGQYFLQVDNFK